VSSASPTGRRVAAAAVALAAVLAVGPSARASDRLRVEDLAVEIGDGDATVDYRLAGSIPEDVVERLDAGMEVSVRHRVELVTKRNLMLAPSRSIARCDIETTATFDSLTRRYRIVRSVRYRDEPEDAREPEIRETDRVEEVRRALTEVGGVVLPLAGLADDGSRRRARVRVSSELGRRWILLMFPVSVSASAEYRLEP